MNLIDIHVHKPEWYWSAAIAADSENLGTATLRSAVMN